LVETSTFTVTVYDCLALALDRSKFPSEDNILYNWRDTALQVITWTAADITNVPYCGDVTTSMKKYNNDDELDSSLFTQQMTTESFSLSV